MTQDELLEALREAMERPETADGLTTRDITKILGISEKKVLKLLGELNEQDLIEPVRVQRRNIAGVLHARPAYRLKQPR